MKQFKLLLGITLLSVITSSFTTQTWNNNPGFSLKGAVYSNGTSILLEWNAAGAFSNTFDIERRDPQGSWQKIGAATSGKETGGLTAYQFIDIDPRNGDNYYRLKYAESNGSYAYSEGIKVEFQHNELGFSFQNYPNPFTTTTTIRYEIKYKARTRVIVMDMNGMLLQQLVNRLDEPGIYTVEWNAYRQAPGTYICQVTTGDQTVNRKLIKVGGS